MSPSSSGTSPGMPCTMTSLTEMHNVAGIAPVVQKGRDPSSFADDALGETVELAGLDPREHPLAHRVQHLVDDPVA